MQPEPVGDLAPVAESAEAGAKPIDGEGSVDEQPANAQDLSQQLASNMVDTGPGGFPGMDWNGNGSFNGMNPFMANAMLNFPNQMGM